MKLSVNGEAHEFSGATVADLLVELAYEPPFAVAVNTVFVPRTRYAEQVLQAGDCVDIVKPVVGG